MNDREEYLVRAFTSLHVPVDRIACFLPLREQFLGLLPVEVRSTDSDDNWIWTLMRLRKRGKLPPCSSEN